MNKPNRFEGKSIFALMKLAREAKVPDIEYLSKGELIAELDDHYFRSWNEAVVINELRNLT